MIALLSSWLWLSLGPVVNIASDAVCPTAAEVAGRVGALLPVRETSDPPDLARIVDRGDALVVTLARSDGTPIGERVLERGSPCGDLAAAAAVVIATWESDVHPEFRVEAPPAPNVAPAELAPSAAPAAHTAPVERTSAPAASVTVAARPSSVRSTTRFDLGAALTGSLAPTASGAGPALGGLLAATWVPSRVGARLAVAASQERDLPLGAGRVHWRRISSAFGPALRLASRTTPWAVDLHAEGLAAWATASGGGFTNDHAASAFDAGLGAGARLAWGGVRAVVPWVELAGAAWLRAPTAFANPGGAAVVLPRGELTFALGLSIRGGP
jgi:hypothetical protein